MQHEGMYNLCIFTLGLVNNLGFNVIVGFSSELAGHFGSDRFFCYVVV